MKILYVATVVKTHIMEFHIPYLKMLKEMGWETAVAARNDYDVPSDCEIPYCDCYYDVPFERNPFRFNNIKAFRILKEIIDNGSFDIVHCHTPVGALLTRLAAQDARSRGTKVFYTAHGFHFYKNAPLSNWLVYYPIEKYLARKTDVLITITHEDYRRAQSFKAGKIQYIPGVGIDINRFARFTLRKNEDKKALRSKYSIPDNATIVLSVGEVNTNKNHKAVIEILPKFPMVWYVICGSGPLIIEHKELAKKLGVSDRVIMTGYRSDIDEFYYMADIFVFPSIREGLPVALMEAMAAGLKCVASRNRGTDDLLPDSRLLFDVNNKNELINKVQLALCSNCLDEIQRNKNRLTAFGIDNTLAIMKKMYLDAVNR